MDPKSTDSARFALVRVQDNLSAYTQLCPSLSLSLSLFGLLIHSRHTAAPHSCTMHNIRVPFDLL